MLVVVLGLGSALSWGAADFLGGLKNRTVPLMAVAIGSQSAALLACLLALPLTDGVPPARVFLYASLAGVANAVGLTAFYRALAIGNMSVVAPIVGMSAVVPVAVGLTTGDRPSALQGGGMLIALLGVVLATRQTDDRPMAGSRRSARTRSIVLALLAAVGVGGNLLGVQAAVTATSAFPLLWTLAVTRATSLVLLALAALASRQRGRLPSGELGGIASLGLLDLAANVLYALAARHALLSLAALVASMHPVVTVVLARFVLDERIRRVQQIGVVCALGGVALIAGG